MARERLELEGSNQSAELKRAAREARDARIEALYREGLPIIRISERLGINPQTVVEAVRRRLPGALTNTRART